MPKKSFTTNPAMTFISQESIAKVDGLTAPDQREKKTPAGYKPNPEYIETKSRRVQVLIQPSVHEAIKAKAQKAGISVNEAINTALKEYVER